MLKRNIHERIVGLNGVIVGRGAGLRRNHNGQLWWRGGWGDAGQHGYAKCLLNGEGDVGRGKWIGSGCIKVTIGDGTTQAGSA